MPVKQPYPFTSKHLVKFKRELKRAGGFDALMQKKLALQTKDDTSTVVRHKDVEEYKNKFLIGAYATLRPYYTTEIPFSFWSKLYMELYGKPNLLL